MDYYVIANYHYVIFTTFQIAILPKTSWSMPLIDLNGVKFGWELQI